MPISSNQTIIGVPLTVENPGQTRQFLVRLIEKLDIVLGYRGDEPYATISDLQSARTRTDSELTQLERTILNVVNNILANSSNALTDLIEQSIEDLKSSSTVSNADTSSQTISDPPTQAQVQALQNQVVTNANRLNDLLSALRGTEIIAT